jgi:hypothetical protein
MKKTEEEEESFYTYPSTHRPDNEKCIAKGCAVFPTLSMTLFDLVFDRAYFSQSFSLMKLHLVEVLSHTNPPA